MCGGQVFWGNLPNDVCRGLDRGLGIPSTSLPEIACLLRSVRPRVPISAGKILQAEGKHASRFFRRTAQSWENARVKTIINPTLQEDTCYANFGDCWLFGIILYCGGSRAVLSLHIQPFDSP